ncbi:hypothetical protein B0T16DRAFT_185641 [Cercophora newfieldiana]|uniref:Secreted protein n=1 Tax=Cercophora newfieldiana TaxID=92897 RepID=A0AA39Y083_9PEZI|nr:hypothetical protein B0T16DRAFT_185641 [Cercophora newfieldiana]
MRSIFIFCLFLNCCSELPNSQGPPLPTSFFFTPYPQHTHSQHTYIPLSHTRFQQSQIGYGVVANIADSHSAARGSIPRFRDPRHEPDQTATVGGNIHIVFRSSGQYVSLSSPVGGIIARDPGSIPGGRVRGGWGVPVFFACCL